MIKGSVVINGVFGQGVFDLKINGSCILVERSGGVDNIQIVREQRHIAQRSKRLCARHCKRDGVYVNIARRFRTCCRQSTVFDALSYIQLQAGCIDGGRNFAGERNECFAPRTGCRSCLVDRCFIISAVRCFEIAGEAGQVSLTDLLVGQNYFGVEYIGPGPRIDLCRQLLDAGFFARSRDLVGLSSSNGSYALDGSACRS
ncbi:hypothetical protein D3C71_1514900 [compost metagenome]